VPQFTHEGDALVELKGSLSGIGLQAIVQLIGEVHHSGNLDLRKASLHGTLAFDDGRLVAAECGEHHGLQALADCIQELADADFTFIESMPTLERTLDFGPSDLKKLMDRITSGEFQSLANGVNGLQQETELRAETTCALLGFADDASRHYSRPTALHRCYASGGPTLVTTQEQRDLCLSGRFPTCPRFRNASHAQPAAAQEALPPPITLITPSVGANATPPPATRPDEAPGVPPGVAARLPPSSGVHRPDAPPASEPEESPRSAKRPSRGVMVIVGGAALGFLLVGVVMLVVVPMLRPARSAQISGTAFEPVAQPTLVPVVPPAVITPPAVATANVSRVTLVPTQTAATQSTPTPLAPPTPVIQVAGGTIMDVRFAAGPAQNWVNNPPYAAWSDGAYRLHAQDAARFVAVGVPLDESMSDVLISATFRKTGGPPGGGYGLIVRDQGPEPRDGVNQQMSAYVLETGDLGEYGVWRRDGDHWVDLVPWMHSTSVRSGGSPNELSVRAVGDELTFSINGVNVATVNDDALAAGGVGLFVGGDTNEVALDRFSVRLPN
jgi:hypothetical protein